MGSKTYCYLHIFISSNLCHYLLLSVEQTFALENQCTYQGKLMKLKTDLFVLFKHILKISRGIFVTLENIYDGAFMKTFSSFMLLANYVRKNPSSSMLDSECAIELISCKQWILAVVNWCKSLSTKMGNHKVTVMIFITSATKIYVL